MKKISFLFAFLVFFLTSRMVFAQSCNMSGTYTIGIAGNFATLKGALDTLRINGVSGPVILELKSTYTSTAETFPLSFGNIPCISSSKNIILRPESGATNLQISSNFIGTTISLSNAMYVTIDGRPGGTGTTKALTITNTSRRGNVVTFSNDASFNSLNYLNITGSDSSIFRGLISFLGSTSSVTNGNSNNLISNCSIGNSAFPYPFNCIYSAGSAGKKNANNRVLNCEIFNYYGYAITTADGISTSNGIYVGANSTDWEITGNSFYQTVARGSNSSATYGININDSTSSGFLIQNNFIGGSAPNCGGTPFTYKGRFLGISISAGKNSFSSVQGNTISNINWEDENAAGFVAIRLRKGKINCGGIAGNIIGSQTQRASIVSTSYHSGPTGITGIVVATDPKQTSTDSFIVSNNKIGGIRTQNAMVIYGNTETYFRAISVGFARASIVISSNILGSPTVEKSIESTNIMGEFVGIDASSFGESEYSPNGCDIINNSIVNWHGKVIAIDVYGGAPRIRNNTIKKLSSEYINSSGYYPRLIGIRIGSVNENAEVTGNTLQDFLIQGTAGESITGIWVSVNSIGALVSRNLITGFRTEDNNNSSSFFGIKVQPTFDGGNFKILNNMISLGKDTTGLLTGHYISGITSCLNNNTIIANNSVYIDGIGGYASAYDILNALSITSITGNNKVVNNILVNNRARSSEPGDNSQTCIIHFEDSLPSIAGLNLNNNIYYTTKPYCHVAEFKNVKYNRINAWRAATGLDSVSVFANPNFINPDGNSATVNLHLANPTPAEAAGIAEPSVYNDFDDEQRSLLSPVDIGADAGNFVYIDPEAPFINHPVFSFHEINKVSEYRIKIRDNGTGVDTAGVNKPRMWFRKTFPTTSTWKSTAGKLIEGNIKKGEWSFFPDFTAAGIALSPGDSVAYYFVAQDKAATPNVGYSDTVGTLHTTVNNQLSAPLNPLRLFIYNAFPDTVYVGNGELYPTLTGEGGFFQASKTYFSKPGSTTHVVITSDLNEPATYGMNMVNYDNSAYIKIMTNTAVVKKIQNAEAVIPDMIRLTNIKNLSIDGSVNGDGRYLEFSNGKPNGQSTTYPLLKADGNIHNFSVRNCIFRSNSTNTTSPVFYLYNDKVNRLTINNNLFTNIETGSYAGLPSILFYLLAINCDSSKVSNNDFTNFSLSGLKMQTTTTLKGSFLIDSNHFYHNSALISAGSKDPISIHTTKGAISITNNFIGGSDRFCAGAPWRQTDNNNSFRAMYLYTGTDSVASVQNNTIQNIRMTSSSASVTGIFLSGAYTNVGMQNGNKIGSTGTDSSIVAGKVTGITVSSTGEYSPTPFARIQNNIVAGIISYTFNGITVTARRGSVIKNQVFNVKANTTFLTTGGLKGIGVFVDSCLVMGNLVYNFNSASTSSQDTYGMEIRGGAALWPDQFTVANNRIYNIKAAGGNLLAGIFVWPGQYLIHNNQISLSNEGYNNNIAIHGISLPNLQSNSYKPQFYYNSIRIFGHTVNNNNSYAAYFNGSGNLAAFKNNLLYNQQTGGTGKHLAVGMLSTAAPGFWPAGIANNNVYITGDTTAVNEWKTNGVVSFSQWQALSLTDSNSYHKSVQKIPAQSLFLSAENGNLNINNLSSLCWVVNERGVPVNAINGDFDNTNGVRSTDELNGKSDIGSDEFNTSTLPLPTTSSLCAGGSSAITSNITGTSYQWQVNTGNGFTDISNNNNYSGVSNVSLQLNNIPSAWYGYQYRCNVAGNYSTILALEVVNYWTGSANSSWENPANWSCGVVPDGNTDVVITAGTVLLSVNGTCRSISIGAGANFTIAPGVKLTVTH